MMTNNVGNVANGTVGGLTAPTVVTGPTSPAHRANAVASTTKQPVTKYPSTPSHPSNTSHPSSTSSNEEEDTLPDGWRQYHTPDGTPYYYNENTKQSSWAKPAIPKAKVFMKHILFIM